MTEFKLHSFSRQMTILYAAEKDEFFNEHQQNGANYHIYMITKVPKLKFIKQSIKQQTNLTRFAIKYESDSLCFSHIIWIPNNNLPFNITDITISDNSKYLTFHDGHGGGFKYSVLSAYLDFSYSPLNNEIVYIGQAFGENANSLAIKNRMVNHETLQEVLLDHINQEPKSDICLILWDFKPRLHTILDGITKTFVASDEEDKERLMRVMQNPPYYISKQLINITEAALINYFKPEYNIKFINNFPSVKHKGYRYYYDLDFHSIIVELDPTAININLYSKKKQYKVFNAIRYNLTNDEQRKMIFRMDTQ